MGSQFQFSFNSQLGVLISSVWFCLHESNKNKVTVVYRVISYLALFRLLFDIYIKTFCVFCQQLTKTFSRKFKNWRFVWNHVLFILTKEKNPTFIWACLKFCYSLVEQLDLYLHFVTTFQKLEVSYLDKGEGLKWSAECTTFWV